LLILLDGLFVCAFFETVVTSQLSPPVGEQGKQDFTRRPAAERASFMPDPFSSSLLSLTTAMYINRLLSRRKSTGYWAFVPERKKFSALKTGTLYTDYNWYTNGTALTIWHDAWAIRYEPLGWECQWAIVEVHANAGSC
jgi:hypothetical protein